MRSTVLACVLLSLVFVNAGESSSAWITRTEMAWVTGEMLGTADQDGGLTSMPRGPRRPHKHKKRF
jgi:hypothetical protein